MTTNSLAAAKITCPNPECQAPNFVSHNFCAHCRTALPKIYLWAVGEDAESLKVGQTLANNRYIVVDRRVLLDTKPGWQPEVVERASEDMVHYLRMVVHRPHVPQVYGCISFSWTGRKTSTLWLLEKGPIYSEGLGAPFSGKLMPELAESWKGAASIRQLNWLWQIAMLWDSLRTEGVVSTLLKPELLRVEGSLVRMLELVTDSSKQPSLVDLGKLWQQWQKHARMSIAQTVSKICSDLIEERIVTATQLIAILDEALRAAGQKQFLNCNYVTLSHTGPRRDQNEDACYPASGAPMYQNTGYDLSLAIVCDGVGGHQGGEVASNLAIDTIRKRVENVLSKPENRYPDSIAIQIETSTCVANDQISLRNDSENRQERQRMGTTMVMGLIYGHEAYIAHVGDSRVYRVTRTGCHQMTLDDDLATREVRLGGALYRDAVSTPGSGSLFQALGMNSSTALHPNLRRTIVDEECIFILCSDGLSDNDRVERNWQNELLPVLEGKVDLTTACQRAINIANTQNGHDNATVALMHCQVKQPIETGQTTEANDLGATSFAQPSTLLLSSPEESPAFSDGSLTTGTPEKSAAKPIVLVGVGVLLLAIVGIVGGGALMFSKQSTPIPVLSPSPTTPPTDEPPPPSPSASPSPPS